MHTVTSKGKGKAKSKRKVGVTVVLLDKMQTDVPKNKERIELERAKKICKIFVARCDSQAEIRTKICSVFNISDYTVLECIRAGSKLITSSNQQLNGVDTIDRRGCLYLCKKAAKVC